MSGTPNGIAVRPGSVPAQAQPSAALELRAGQTMWTRDQHAALVAMGIPAKATSAELGVFLHQCQRTGLDPFSKQIYLIYRKVKDGDRWVEKPTTQIGIDGFRVIRDRIADEKGRRVEYEDTLWYSPDGQAHDVWLWDEPAAACKVTVLVDGRRFPSVLRFNEYCQFGREDANGNRPRTGRWRDGHAHQIEKCAEADALRKAFPNDMAGLLLEDAAPLSDPDAPDRLPSDRPRVTAEQARARAAASQTVTAEVITPDASPAGPEDLPPVPSEPAATPSQAAAAPAGEAPARQPKLASSGQVGMIIKHFERIGGYKYDDESDEQRTDRLRRTSRLAGIEYPGIAKTEELTADEAARVLVALQNTATPADAEAVSGQ